MPSDKPTDKPKHWQVPQAVKDTAVVTKTSKKGNKYTMWTEAWFKNTIRGQMREIFARWPRRKEVLNRVREEEWPLTKTGKERKRPVVWYKCEECSFRCKENTSKANPKNYRRIWVDHVHPVVPPGVDVGWQEYLDRLFCDPDNLQALCTECHKAKTNRERSERMKLSKRSETPSWRN